MTSAVARRYRFNATHCVPGLPSPWGEPHRHEYTVEVVVEGQIDEELPVESDPFAVMVVDTDLLDKRWEEIAPALRNTYLNDALSVPTTVEALSAWLLGHFDGLDVAEVTVWEDAQRWGRARV